MNNIWINPSVKTFRIAMGVKLVSSEKRVFERTSFKRQVEELVLSQEPFRDCFSKAASQKSAHFLPVLSNFQKRRSQDFISRPVKNTTAGMSLHCLIHTVLGNGFQCEDKKHRKPNVLCKVNGKTLFFITFCLCLTLTLPYHTPNLHSFPEQKLCCYT